MKKNKNDIKISPFGGEKKDCGIFSKKANYIEKLPVVWDIMEAIQELLKIYNKTNFPHVLKKDEIDFNLIGLHGHLRQRLSLGTVERNLRYMRFMDTHTKQVDFKNPNIENWYAHVDYREITEFDNFKDGIGIGAIKHEWQAMRMVLRSKGIKIWDYQLPPQREVIKKFPTPKQVYKIIKHKWSNNKYINALVQYYLTFNFIIGWRPPSEPAYMKTSNVYYDKDLVKIVEPKKHFRERLIEIPEILKGKHVKSIENWNDYWRPKVVNEKSGDYLFLQPNGKPFWNDKTKSGDKLRIFINKIITPGIYEIYPEYYNYCSRHFCGVARLIRTFQKNGSYDIYEVSRHLGHTKLDTTLNYVKDARLYSKKFNYDWINRVLKSRKSEGKTR